MSLICKGKPDRRTDEIVDLPRRSANYSPMIITIITRICAFVNSNFDFFER